MMPALRDAKSFGSRFSVPIALPIIVCLSIVGCSSSGGGGGDDPPEDEGPATSEGPLQSLESCLAPDPALAVICGEVLAADQVTPLQDAEIYPVNEAPADAGDGCFTDELGEYACLLPTSLSSGAQQFAVAAEGFEQQTIDVTVSPGEVSSVAAQALTGDSTENWLAQTGDFDQVEVLLAELKGCADPQNCVEQGLTVTSDLDTVSLDGFDAVYVNCGSPDSIYDAVPALQSYVESGGHLYLSDLEAPVLDALFPNTISFGYSTFTSTGTTEAAVTYAPLAALIGPTVDIVFDLPYWIPIESVNADVTTFVEGDISSMNASLGVQPITVGFRPSDASGCVFFSSYHLEGDPSGNAQELALKYLVQNMDQVCE